MPDIIDLENECLTPFGEKLASYIGLFLLVSFLIFLFVFFVTLFIRYLRNNKL